MKRRTAGVKGTATPNAELKYTVLPGDLPLHCPMPDMSLWNSHPRVYLPVEESGFAKCPYCLNRLALRSQLAFIDPGSGCIDYR